MMEKKTLGGRYEGLEASGSQLLLAKSHHIKCERQPTGSNLCGYFVSEWIRSEVSERNPGTFLQVRVQICV